MIAMTASLDEQRLLEDRYRIAVRRVGMRLLLILSLSVVAQLLSERLAG